jgi:hypothetical protein
MKRHGASKEFDDSKDIIRAFMTERQGVSDIIHGMVVRQLYAP